MFENVGPRIVGYTVVKHNLIQMNYRRATESFRWSIDTLGDTLTHILCEIEFTNIYVINYYIILLNIKYVICILRVNPN